MRRCTGRASVLALALCLLAPLAQAGDDTNPGHDLPAPSDAGGTPPSATADEDEARRLEGDAAGKDLATDVGDADKAAQDAIDAALDRGAPQGPRRSAQAAAGELSGVVALGLAEAISIGLERNLDLQVRFDPTSQARTSAPRGGSADPTFANEFGYSSVAAPNFSLFTLPQQVIQQNELDGKTGLKGLVPWWGASYEIGYTGSRLYSSSTSAGFSPQLDANVYGNISMPLLRNLIWNQAWTQLKTSQVVFQGTREEFRRQVMDIVQRIENAYWDVIATREQLRVAQKSVETARALLDQTKTQYEVGVISKVEVTEAEAGVAQRDFNLIVASNAYRAAEDSLSDLVFGEPASRVDLPARDDRRARELHRVFDVDPKRPPGRPSNRPELAAAKPRSPGRDSRSPEPDPAPARRRVELWAAGPDRELNPAAAKPVRRTWPARSRRCSSKSILAEPGRGEQGLLRSQPERAVRRTGILSDPREPDGESYRG
jgi:hypothetical protein